MLRKVASILIRCDDLEAGAAYYADVFGLRRVWASDTEVGFAFPESDATLILHQNPRLPTRLQVHYAVDDVGRAVEELARNGCTVLAEPFPIWTGKCAVIKDPFGAILCLQDWSGAEHDGDNA